MSEEVLINVTPQETRVAVVENGVLQGEPGFSRAHLTCVRAGERPHTEVRAGVEQSQGSRARMAGTDNRRPWS